MSCIDRHGHDLQIGDRVVIAAETGENNRWYVYRIVVRGEFQDVHILRRQDVVLTTGYMECQVCSNNDLILLEHPMNERDDWRRREFKDRYFEGETSMCETARFTPGMILVLHVRNTDKEFEFDGYKFEELVIGRKDLQTGEAPDVDLWPYGALEKGVSRRHATIIRKDGSLQIVDNGTSNGTFLNGRKLEPRQPSVVRDGDEIRLGKLVLRTWFRGDSDLLAAMASDA